MLSWVSLGVCGGFFTQARWVRRCWPPSTHSSALPMLTEAGLGERVLLSGSKRILGRWAIWQPFSKQLTWPPESWDKGRWMWRKAKTRTAGCKERIVSAEIKQHPHSDGRKAIAQTLRCLSCLWNVPRTKRQESLLKDWKHLLSESHDGAGNWKSVLIYNTLVAEDCFVI